MLQDMEPSKEVGHIRIVSVDKSRNGQKGFQSGDLDRKDVMYKIHSY